MIQTPIDRHAVSVLQFSGGKDSLACLHLLRPFWDRLVVMWCNTGDAFPETVEQMREIERMVPRFIEVNTDARAQITQYGWPVDIMPVNRGAVGRAIEGHAKQMMQPYTTCCGANKWHPMDAAARDLGATLVIRGQRNSERMKAPIRSGATYDGIEYWFPIEAWSEKNVFAYLHGINVPAPAHYAHTGTSLDCMHCTAWIGDAGRTIRWMRDAHPAEYGEVARRLWEIRGAAEEEVRQINRVLDDVHG